MPQENYNILQHFASIPGMQDMLRKQMQYTAGLQELPTGGFFHAAHAAQQAAKQFPAENYQLGQDTNGPDTLDTWLSIDKNLRPDHYKQQQDQLALEALFSQLIPSLAQQNYERKWSPPLQ